MQFHTIKASICERRNKEKNMENKEKWGENYECCIVLKRSRILSSFFEFNIVSARSLRLLLIIRFVQLPIHKLRKISNFIEQLRKYP